MPLAQELGEPADRRHQQRVEQEDLAGDADGQHEAVRNVARRVDGAAQVRENADTRSWRGTFQGPNKARTDSHFGETNKF